MLMKRHQRIASLFSDDFWGYALTKSGACGSFFGVVVADDKTCGKVFGLSLAKRTITPSPLLSASR